MKKLITVLMMGLMMMGCEESSGPAASTSKAPATTAPIADEPVIDPAPVYKTVTIQLNTSEPTQYQIRIERYTDDVGFDVENPVVFDGTTSQSETIRSFNLEYKCRVYFFKMETFSPSSVLIKLDSVTQLTQSIGGEYWIGEVTFVNL